jgi:hypothetical protein
LDEASSLGESATGMRSSRSLSLSLLAITIADLSSPITTRKKRRRFLVLSPLIQTSTPCVPVSASEREIRGFQMRKESWEMTSLSSYFFCTKLKYFYFIFRFQNFENYVWPVMVVVGLNKFIL